MARGGKREGAGRKVAQHTIETEAARKRLIELVVAELDELILPQIERAKKGDTVAFKELMERSLGKVTAPVDVTSKGKAIMGNHIAFVEFKEPNGAASE